MRPWDNAVEFVPESSGEAGHFAAPFRRVRERRPRAVWVSFDRRRRSTIQVAPANGDAGSRRLHGFRRHYPVSPKTSDPDRSVGVAALEGDPDVRTIRREVKPSTGIRIRRARHRPQLFILSEDVRDEHTKSSTVQWIEVANYLSSVQAEEALAHHSVWFRAVGRGPFPLRSPERR